METAEYGPEHDQLVEPLAQSLMHGWMDGWMYSGALRATGLTTGIHVHNDERDAISDLLSSRPERGSEWSTMLEAARAGAWCSNIACEGLRVKGEG